MRSISALDVRARFGQVLDEAAAGERFIVERGGLPIAAIVPLSDVDHLDPDRVRERRLEAAAEVVTHGRRYRMLHPEHVDGMAAQWIREDRDHGHRR
jgi:prevent-host-death family protein